MSRACRNCQWWIETGRRSGQCRGAPPVAKLHNAGERPVWPSTEPSDWCGAFRIAERMAGGITDAEFEDAHRRMAERLAGVGKGTEQ
jgi:hypothetical protein